MRPRSNYLLAGLAGLVILLAGPSSLQAKDRTPPFVAPGFQFDQVDAICVMPLISAVNMGQGVDLDGVRLALIEEIQQKGYRVLDLRCSESTAGTPGQGMKPRWILTVKVDGFVVSKGAPNHVMGSAMTASLFDTESAKEVWRDSAETGFGGRFANNLLGNTVEGAVESGIGSVLSKLEKQKKHYPPSPETIWPPMVLQARLYRVHSFTECNGVLSFDAGTLKFEPGSNGKSDGSCESFRFTVQGAKFGVGMWLIVPGKSRYFLQQPGEKQIVLLDLALRSAL